MCLSISLSVCECESVIVCEYMYVSVHTCARACTGVCVQVGLYVLGIPFRQNLPYSLHRV